MSSPAIAFGVFLLGTSCSLPPYEHEGEHVIVATDLVDKVCAGTIGRLDRGVDHIDEQLGIPAPTERLRVAILDPEEAMRQCFMTLPSCAYQIGAKWVVILQPSYLDRSGTHELVHSHLGNSRSSSLPLFKEGVAVALGPAICISPEVDLPTADQVLSLPSWGRPTRAVYYLGGELVSWLLEVHGPEPVMDFFATLQRPEVMAEAPDPEFVRASYRAHFGTEFDDDLYAHIRAPDQLSAVAAGCVAPELPWEGDQLHLHATLDCDSPRVENDFKVAGRVFVEWTLNIPETQAGKRYRLLDALPANTALTLYRCVCDSYQLVEQPAWTDESAIGANLAIEPGTYRIRWRGSVDPNTELNVRIEAYSN